MNKTAFLDESSLIHVNKTAFVPVVFDAVNATAFACSGGRCCSAVFVHERAAADAPPMKPTVKARRRLLLDTLLRRADRRSALLEAPLTEDDFVSSMTALTSQPHAWPRERCGST